MVALALLRRDLDIILVRKNGIKTFYQQGGKKFGIARHSVTSASIHCKLHIFRSQCRRVSRLLKYVLLLCFTTTVKQITADGIMFYLLSFILV